MDNENFSEITEYLSDRIKNILKYLPENVKNEAYEIRLRENRPLVLFGSKGAVFIGENSSYSSMDSRYGAIVTKNDIEETAAKICGYSVYSHQNEMAEGFVTFGKGHRAGFCGAAVFNGSTVSAVKNISSLNIRIAREVPGAADEILKRLYSQEKFPGIIIAGPPCAGKTTVLKNFAEQVSGKYTYGYRKTVVIDERYEMSGITGANCDILRGYPKDLGIIHAMRVLSPEVIICDEISSPSEADKVIAGLNCGIKFIVSLHAKSEEDLIKKSAAKILINSGEFEYIVLLKDSFSPGQIKRIIRTEDVEYGSSGRSGNNKFFCDCLRNSAS